MSRNLITNYRDGVWFVGFCCFFLIYYKKWLRDGWELRMYMYNDSFTFHPYGERLIVDQTCFLSFFFFSFLY